MDSSAAGVAGLTDARTLVRQVMAAWPVVVLVTLVALASSLVALESRRPSYSATAKLLISPLPQWDQTFLGTSLIRDSGDATLTASTVAEMLKTPDVAFETARSMGPRWTAGSIRRAVTVQAVEDTNVITATARAAQPDVAVGLADEYARAALRVRWRAIEREITRRTELAEETGLAIPSEGGEEKGVQVLNFIQLTGSDPTLTFQGTTPAERDKELKSIYVIVLAVGGGLFLGSLAALGMSRWRPRSASPDQGLLRDKSDALTPVR
jgi:uncharacterized protein involved in exopolysaccharide biosynthesis